MLRSKHLFMLMTLVLVLTTVLSGCAGTGAGSAELRYNLNGEPPTLDPSLAEDTTSNTCIEQLFLGLTDFNDKSEVVPELATEWKVSADGLVWTFKMRKDAQWVQYDPATKKFAKKRPVTANDVVYAVKRTIDPATASNYAYVDYIIKNAEAVNTGESKDLDSVGVKAVDDYTVEFTLEQPAGYFPGIAGMWVNRPQPKEAIDTGGDKWTEPGTIWTNGPYALESWEHEAKMTMVKNTQFFNAKNVQIGKLSLLMVAEESTEFAMYENGELDVANPPLDDMDRVKADATLSKELYIAPSLCTYYYGFNTTKPPMDNPKVRLAFSLAIDRQKLIDTVTKGEQKPAKSFACPGIFGNVAEDANFKGVAFDPAAAKKALADAGYPEGKGLPEVTLTFNTSEGHQKIAQFIQQSWKDNLGVEVKLANQEWAVYLKAIDEDAPMIYRLGWCADYPDENNFLLEVFHPKKSSNPTKWNADSEPAKKFMELTEKAAASADPAERKNLYAQAEQILVVDEAIMAPIYYYTTVVCTKPNVKRTYNPMSLEHFDQWSIEK